MRRLGRRIRGKKTGRGGEVVGGGVGGLVGD